MNSFRKIVLCAVSVVAVVSCKSQFDTLLSSNDVDSKYKAAFDYFDKGKYQKAASLFESMSVLTDGTERDDTVQYYWGLSNYNYKDYVTAESNFSRFVTNFPRSPFVENARFLRIDCLYKSTYRYELDQNPTRLAIAAIQEYRKDYGTDKNREECDAMLEDLNGRLDRKAFEGAKLYYNMEDYKASRVAFRNALKDNAENIYREDMLYYIAKSSYKYAQLSVPSKQKERYMIFVDDYLNFVGEIQESPYTKELKTLYARAQKALGKYSGVDEQDGLKDKDFEKERKAAAKVAGEASKTADKAAKKVSKKAAAAESEVSAGE